MRRRFLLIFTFFSIIDIAFAQNSWKIELGARQQLTDFHKPFEQAREIPRIGYDLFLLSRAPLGKSNFSLSFGFQYSKKNFKREFLFSSPQGIDRYYQLRNLDFLEVPISLNYTFKSKSKIKFSMEGGISYGFIIRDRIRYDADNYPELKNFEQTISGRELYKFYRVPTFNIILGSDVFIPLDEKFYLRTGVYGLWNQTSITRTLENPKYFNLGYDLSLGISF